MFRRLGRFALSGVCALGIAAIILFVSYAVGFRLSRNTSNLWYVLKLTIPLALLLACIAAIAPVLREKSTSFRSSLLLVAIGVAVGCAYWCIILRTAGLGFLSLAIQALACWVAAAVATLLMVLGRWSYRVLASASLICALGIVLPSPTFNLLAHNQLLTVAIVVPEGLTSVSTRRKEIGFDSQSQVEECASHVLKAIQAAGLQGNYQILQLSRQGEGKQSLAIVIVDGPVSGRTLLAEPDATEVVYLQRPKGWTKIPAQAPTLRRSIEVWGASHEIDSLAYFGIPDATGASLMARVSVGEQANK